LLAIDDACAVLTNNAVCDVVVELAPVAVLAFDVTAGVANSDEIALLCALVCARVLLVGSALVDPGVLTEGSGVVCANITVDVDVAAVGVSETGVTAAAVPAADVVVGLVVEVVVCVASAGRVVVAVGAGDIAGVTGVCAGGAAVVVATLVVVKATSNYKSVSIRNPTKKKHCACLKAINGKIVVTRFL
jgi:hypothetical protein